MNPDTYFPNELYDRNWFSQHSTLTETPVRNISAVATSPDLVRLGDQSKCMPFTDMPLDLSPHKTLFYSPLEHTGDGPLDLSMKTSRRSLESRHHASTRNVSKPVTSQLNVSRDQSNRHTPSGTFGQYHHRLTKDGKFVLRREAIVYGCAESVPQIKYEPPFGGQSQRSIATIGSSKSAQQSQTNLTSKSKINIGNTLNHHVTRTEEPRKLSVREVFNDGDCDSQIVYGYKHVASPRCSPDSTNLCYAQLPSKCNNPNMASSFVGSCITFHNDSETNLASTLGKPHTNTTCVRESMCPSADSIDKMSTSIKVSNIMKMHPKPEKQLPAQNENSNPVGMTILPHHIDISDEKCRIIDIPVSCKPIPSPLQISIDSDSKPISKLCSRKHKILEAVSRDDRLRSIVSYDKFSKETSVSNGKLYDATDICTHSGSCPDLINASMASNCPVSPASPVMPILSPQSRYPEPLSSASISEPPALDPAMILTDGNIVKVKTEDGTFNKLVDTNRIARATVASFETKISQTGRSALFPKKRNIPVANVVPNVHLHDSPLKADASEIASNGNQEEIPLAVKSQVLRNVVTKARHKRKLKCFDEESALGEQKQSKHSEGNILPSQMVIASKKKRVDSNKVKPDTKNSRTSHQSLAKGKKKESVKQGPRHNDQSEYNQLIRKKVVNSIVVESKLGTRVLSKSDFSLYKENKIVPRARKRKQDTKKEQQRCREIKKPRRSSMLGEIANSNGYIDEAKQRRSSTDNLLVDPSLLSREDKALRRAMLEFSKLETRLHNKPRTAKEVKDNCPSIKLKEQIILASPKTCGKKQPETDIRNVINHQGLLEAEPCLQPPIRFVDFQPLLLKSRTRCQAAGSKGLRKFNRNDAYDNELTKEEVRNAMFRKQRHERFLQKLREAKAANLDAPKVATAASTVSATIDSCSVVSDKQVTKPSIDDPADNHNDGCWQIQTSLAPPPRPTRGRKKSGKLTLKLRWRPNEEDQIGSWRGKKPPRKGYSQSSYQLVKKASMAGLSGKRGKFRKRVSGGRKFFSRQRRKQKVTYHNYGLDVGSDEFCSNAALLPHNDLSESSFTSHTVVPVEVKRIMVNKNSGETLLHRAARQGYEKVALYCLKNGSVDVNARDNAGFSALHDCCVHGNLKIARLLLQYGAEVNCASQDGTRPLHDASDNNRHEIVRLLLSCEADPQLATYSGRTPLSMARTVSMRQLLKGYLGDLNGFEDRQHEIPWQFKGTTDLSDSKDDSGMDIFADVPSDAEEDDDDFDCLESAQFHPYNICIAPFDSFESFVLVDDILEQFPALSSSLGKVGSQLPVVTISKTAFLEGAKSSMYYPYLKRYCSDITEDIRLVRAENMRQIEGKLKHMQETLDTFNQCSPDIQQDFHTNNDDFEFEAYSDISYDLEVSSDGSVEYLSNTDGVASGQNDTDCFARLTDVPVLPPYTSSSQVQRSLFGQAEYETVKSDSHCFDDVVKGFASEESLEKVKKTTFQNLDNWMIQTAEIPNSVAQEHHTIVATYNDVDLESDTEESVHDNSCEPKELQCLQYAEEFVVLKEENSKNDAKTHSALYCGDPFPFRIGITPQECFGICEEESSESFPGDIAKSTLPDLPKPSDSVLER